MLLTAETIKAMATFQPYGIPFFFEGFALRQLATLPTKEKQTEFINYIKAPNGTTDGNWYKFTHEKDFHETVKHARTLDGAVYDLPPKKGD
ncbi:hypothetical protein BC826DRAFT_517867 [Russula brevipes]|nr:hypothetical protein BC826DRAFT_517867 [Russula brevipes]